MIRSAAAIAIGLLFLDLALIAPPVQAHGGVTVVRTTAGPYRIEATVTRRGGRIDETIVVLEDETLEPVSSAQVAVTLVARDGQQAGPLVARSLGTGFEVLYPPPEGNAGWRVRITVVGAGQAEPVEVEHPFQAPGQEWAVGSGMGGLVLAVLGIAIPVGIVLLLLRPERRTLGGAGQERLGAPDGDPT